MFSTTVTIIMSFTIISISRESDKLVAVDLGKALNFPKSTFPHLGNGVDK